jgi:hypothetical protein
MGIIEETSRRLSLVSYRVQVEVLKPVVFDLSTPAAITDTKMQIYDLKERAHYNIIVKFVVEYDPVSGLKCTNKVYRKWVRVFMGQTILVSLNVQTVREFEGLVKFTADLWSSC